MKQQIEDPIVMKVLAKYAERSQKGIEKYGTMLTRTDLDLTDWLNHLQEELMDATLYIEKLKQEVKSKQDVIAEAKKIEKQQIIEFAWTYSDLSLADIEKEFNETFKQKQ
jgi:hypothetical protein